MKKYTRQVHVHRKSLAFLYMLNQSSIFFNKIFALNIKNTDFCMLIVKECTWNFSKINKIINQLLNLHIECYNLQFQFNLCLWTSVFNVISHLLGTTQKSCLSPKPQAYCTNNRALSCTIGTNYYIQGWSSQKLHRVVCSGKKKKNNISAFSLDSTRFTNACYFL